MYKTSKAQGPIVNNLLEMYSPLCFSFKERTLRVEAVDIKQEKKGNDKENVKGGFCLLYCEVEMFVIGFGYPTYLWYSLCRVYWCFAW